MSNKFEFKKKSVLDIAGNEFEVDTSSPDLIEKVLKFSDEAIKRGKELTNYEAEGNYAQALRDTIKFCCESIDSILGDGSTKTIFKDKPISLFDSLDVLNYIIDEVKQQNASRFDKYKPNRTQRRSTKK